MITSKKKSPASLFLSFVLLMTFSFSAQAQPDYKKQGYQSHVAGLENRAQKKTESQDKNSKIEEDEEEEDKGKTSKNKKSKKTSKNKKRLWEYKKKHFNLYSLKSDIKFGEKYMKLQINEFKKQGIGVDLPKHAALKSRVEKIVKRIAAVSDLPDLPYEVHIFDKPDIVNAFCMPGGKIGVFSGLFDKEKGFVDMNSDDQIAAVMAHEISHATMRHVTRRLTTNQGLSLVGTAASIGLGSGIGKEAQMIFENLYFVGLNLYFPSYSRKYEKEADQVGLYYMAKAKFDTQAAVDIWEKAASRGGTNSKKTHFFASHPASGERAKSLSNWLPDAQLVKSGEKQ